MNTETEDLNINEDEDDDEDDPFSMAVKELSETNRQADEIARVRITLLHYRIYIYIIQSYFSNVRYNHNHRLYQHLQNHNHFQIYQYFQHHLLQHHGQLFCTVFMHRYKVHQSFDCNDRLRFHLDFILYRQQILS
jgi:hypothetical protein